MNIEKEYGKSGPIIITSDGTLMRVVLQNLLLNAMAYTPAKGKISIGIETTKESIRIAISDNGCGIPKAAVSKIYTKFFRADNAREKQPNGTGLGLYITKLIVERLGGAISFISKENEGTTFFVNIPIVLTEKRDNASARLSTTT